MKTNNSIKINCTSEQKTKIKNQAEKIGLTLQEFILKVCLNTEISIQIKSR
jgi:predicted DNA binding CopG/RHH family protein